MQSHSHNDYGMKHIIARTTSKLDPPIDLSRIRAPSRLGSLKPEVTHFPIFSSRAWDRIPSEKRKALDPQSTKCIFVGYPDGVKGYRLIDLSMDQLIIERSVKFEESISHAPHELHVGTFFLPPIGDDQHAHANSSSYESSNSEDSVD
jgi:hypothetical protein